MCEYSFKCICINSITLDGSTMDNWHPGTLEKILELKPNQVNERFHDFTPLHYCLFKQLWELDSNELDNKQISNNPVEDNPAFQHAIDLMLSKCDHNTFLIPKTPYSTVLHILIRFNYLHGIESVLKRLQIENPCLLQEILRSKNKEGLSPLFYSLTKTSGLKIAEMLLDYGADANELITETQKSGVLTNDGLTVMSCDHIPRSRNINAMEYALRNCNHR